MKRIEPDEEEDIPESMNKYEFCNGELTMYAPKAWQVGGEGEHIAHIYTLAKVGNGSMSHYISSKEEEGDGDEAIIHHLYEYADVLAEYDVDFETEIVTIIWQSELHELTHWGCRGYDDTISGDGHTFEWDEVLMDVIKYVKV